MRRFQAIKVTVLVAAIAGLLSTTVPAAMAVPSSDHPRANAETNRPIKDWSRDKRDPIENGLQSNGQNAFLPNHWNFDAPGYWSAGGFAPYGCGMTDEIVKAVDEKTKFQGRITEIALPDGRAEVHVDIRVRNSPLTVFRNEEMFAWLGACFGGGAAIPLPDPIAGEGSDGSYDYELELVMIIPEPGGVIANWLSVVNGFVVAPYEVTYLRIDGRGTATFTDAAAIGTEGFIPGTTAIVNLYVENNFDDIFTVDLEIGPEA